MYSFFLIRQLLKIHIESLYGEDSMCADKQVCLSRDPQTAMPRYDKTDRGARGWNRQLLDRNFNGLVSADLETRRQYMRNRVVVLKTFWDISTNFRARRLNELMEIAWPDL